MAYTQPGWEWRVVFLLLCFFYVNLVLFPVSSYHTPPIHKLFLHYCSYVDSFMSAVSVAAPLLCCVIVCLFASCFSNKKETETEKWLKRMKGLVRVIYTLCINTFKMETLNEM